MEEERALQVFAFTLRGEIARELKNNFTYEDKEESTTLLETWGNSDGWEGGGWKGLPNRHLFSHMEVNVIQTSKLIYQMRMEKMKGK